MTKIDPAPTGLTAQFFGTSASSTFYYWVQALMPNGEWSQLTRSNALTNVPASFDHLNLVLVKWNPVPLAVLYNVFRTTTTTQPGLAPTQVAQTTSSSYTDKGQSAFGTPVCVPYAGLRFAQARYDFAIDGGGSTSVATNLTNSDTIPINAILVAAIINVGTALGGATNILLGVSSGGSSSTILASTAIGSVTGVVAGAPLWTAPVKMTAAGQITFETTGAALNAGTFDVLVAYYLPPV